MKATPVQTEYTAPAVEYQGRQSAKYQGRQSGEYQGRQEDINYLREGQEGVQYEGIDGKEYRYYPQPGRKDAQPSSRLPTYSDQFQATIRQRRVVNQPRSQVLRQCWVNPLNAETEGCRVQHYQGQVYDICRCGTDLCNGCSLHRVISA